MYDPNQFRRRRSSAGTKEAQVKQTPKKRKPYILSDENSKPYHVARDSLFSSASGFTNYRGFLNLCIILLVMSTGRLVLENVLKYGFRVDFYLPLQFLKDPTAWPSALALAFMNVFIFFSITIEKLLEKRKIKERHGNFLSVLNVFMAIVSPAVYLWYRKANPISSCIALLFYTSLSMKLWSYFSVNRAHRYVREHGLRERKEEDLNNNLLTSKEKKLEADWDKLEKENEPPKLLVEYPNNLNYKDMYYFMLAPTLCYELNFPRTKRIRTRFLIKRAVEMVFLFTLWFILINQWMVPILQNSQKSFRETDVSKIVERLLKFAIPNHICWLIGFYCVFHSSFNFLSEILRFGDREFYREWWNAETVGDFWKNWNIPVHNFCTRHIYKPLLSFGVTKFQSQLIVFFISAFFHEYIISIPLRMFRLWSFMGMLSQLPLSVVVHKYLPGSYGNMAIWLSLIIGQPLAVFMYIHDYYIDYYKFAPIVNITNTAV